jgi:PAS domain S-box-containing protein
LLTMTTPDIPSEQPDDEQSQTIRPEMIVYPVAAALTTIPYLAALHAAVPVEGQPTTTQQAMAMLMQYIEAERIEHQALCSTPASITLYDLDCNIVFINEAGANRLGKAAEVIIGRPLMESLIPKEISDVCRKMCKMVQRTKESATLNVSVGESVFEITYNPIEARNGEIISIAETVYDVTEFNKTLERLSESEMRYRIASEAVSDYAYVLNINDSGTISISWITDAFTRITGYTKDEIQTMELDGWVYREDIDILNQSLARLVQGESDETRIRIITKNGDQRWIRMRSKGVPDIVTGKITKIYGGARDITNFVRAEELRVKSEEETRLLLNNTPHSFYLLDTNGTVVMCNDAAKRMIDSLMGTESIVSGIPLHDVLPSVYGANIDAMIQGTLEGNSIEYDREIVFPSGASKWVHVVFSPARNASKEIIGVTVSVEDITQRVQMMQALVTRERTARAEDLIDAVRHDFNNLLAAILGNAQLITLADTLDEATDSAQQIATLTQQAGLLIKRLSTEEIDEHTVEALDVRDLIASVLATVTVGAEVEIVQPNIGAELPIQADRKLLQVAFTNIVQNGLSAMRRKVPDQPRQPHQLTLRHWDNDTHVFVSISDTGNGISPSIISRVFERYFTTEDAPTTKGKGLGLHNALSAIQAHHGTISLRSVTAKETEAPVLMWDVVFSDGIVSKQGIVSNKNIRTGSTFYIKLPKVQHDGVKTKISNTLIHS